MKIHKMEVKLYRTDGQTDMTKLMVAFRIFRTRIKIKPLHQD